MSEQLSFPEGFLWGSSMSSHQVEGGNSNDWTEWEKSEKRLEFLKNEGLLEKHGLENFISKNSADHFNLYKKDFDLAKELGHNTIRISLEWSRVEPNPDEFSAEALNHYAEVLDHLKILGIEPFVTLWHWTIPLWLRDMGGWQNKNTPKLFARYAEKVASQLGNKVKFWVTLNEPELYANQTYLLGIWPPQKKNPYLYLRVIKNLIKAHRITYDILKSKFSTAQIGIAKNNIHFVAHQKLWFNRLHAGLAHYWWNDYFLRKINDKQDYIGLNYYFRNILHRGKVVNENFNVSDLGWELYPEGIYHLLKDLKKFDKPIYITENGLADATDKQRSWFIVQILKFVHRSIKEGVDVRGYLHWSLIDNFEWDKGFYPRFGLVEVDYKTKARKVRESAKFYAGIIKNNHLNQDHLKVGKLP